MVPLTGLERQRTIQVALVQAAKGSVEPCALTKGHEAEVLEFLAAEPLHNVYMAGFIHDKGLVSPLNRGTFYACRNEVGRLEGVALIGHVTQLDVRTNLGRILLSRSDSVCLLVNERNVVAQSFYCSVGYKLRDLYDTVYLYGENN